MRKQVMGQKTLDPLRRQSRHSRAYKIEVKGMTVFHGHVMTLHILTLAHMLIKLIGMTQPRLTEQIEVCAVNFLSQSFI